MRPIAQLSKEHSPHPSQCLVLCVGPGPEVLFYLNRL
jgi:hypothetical protein